MYQDHLISASHLSREDVEAVLDRAADIDADPAVFRQRHTGKIFGLCFSEPSTRTRMSLDSMMKRLGGQTIDMGPVKSSSIKEGETLADIVRVVKGCAGALVLRHPSGSVATMTAEFVDVPLVNAGGGTDQHPSQTLLDLYTIQEDADLDDLTIGIMDDLKYGRTVHSLAEALVDFDISQYFISPESLQLPQSIRYDLHASGAQVREHTELDEVLPEPDAFCVTRIQREHFPDENGYRKVTGQYQIDSGTLDATTDNLTVMHPLPRIGEIFPDIGDTGHATYSEQAHNGIPVRMAFLDILLSQD